MLVAILAVYGDEGDETLFDSLGYDVFENWKAEVERTAEVTQNATIFSLTQEYWDAIQRLVRLTDYGILKGWVDRETRKVFPHLMEE